jgi:hypothetical protein
MSKINKKNAEIHSNAILETPNLIVLWMISLIPDSYFISDKTTFFDPACGRGTFLKYIYFKLRQNGHGHQNAISRIFGVDKYSPANETSDIFPNIIKKDFLKMDFPSSWPKEFDVVLSNPPYSDQLHLKFFVRCIEIAKDKVVFVHPSTPYIDKKGVTPIYTEIKDLIKNKIEYLSIFNGNPDFGIRLKYPCSIIVVDKNKNNPEFIFDDQLNYKKPIKIDKIENISIFGNDLRFFSFKHKILSKIGETGNLHNRSTLGDKTANGNYMVTYSPIAGSTEDKDKEKRFTKSNYFIIAGRPHLEVLSPEAERRGITWYFDTEEEAKNFIEYTKLDPVRACVAITKISANLHRGELRTVPYLNFKEKWTEDKFNSFFSISDEEKGFIKEIIEPFY